MLTLQQLARSRQQGKNRKPKPNQVPQRTHQLTQTKKYLIGQVQRRTLQGNLANEYQAQHADPRKG